MRSISSVQTTLTRLRKKQKKFLENKNIESYNRVTNAIHTLEWVLEIQNNPTKEPTD